ncbi:hypothetical protein [Glutamicibacter mishrai]|uniref:hypothetical protein n=1 Tax=Glutamicibacter mishrai TaxID=1775880 RepID=UPI001558A340|nr:hypothetical protein [Glutamicibacter mishrai]
MSESWKMSSGPSAAKNTVSHHVEFQPPVHEAIAASSIGPVKIADIEELLVSRKTQTFDNELVGLTIDRMGRAHSLWRVDLRVRV